MRSNGPAAVGEGEGEGGGRIAGGKVRETALVGSGIPTGN